MLTEEEHAAIDTISKFAVQMRAICGEGSDDWREAADKIHQLQAMVMAQAAARTYPSRYRPLGGWPEEVKVTDEVIMAPRRHRRPAGP